jgi:hypothetical protein
MGQEEILSYSINDVLITVMVCSSYIMSLSTAMAFALKKVR